jgi:hypothetical protein
MGGPVMRKVYILMLAAGLSVGPVLARPQRPSESATLKARQEEELQALKLKQKYARAALGNSGLPKAVRVQLKHELKREERKLRQKQKDERQSLKDRERLLNLEIKELGSE